MILTLDTLTAGGQFAYSGGQVVNGVEYVLTDLKGWFGTPAPRPKRTNRPTAAGAHRAASYKSVRTITVEVVGTSIDFTALPMRVAEQQVAALCSNPALLYPLTVEDHTGRLVAYVELDGEILPALRDGMDCSTRWSIPLAAPDPRRFAVSWTAASAPANVTGVGGVVSTGSGVVSTGGGVASGTAPTPPIGTVSAVGTDTNGLVFAITGPTSGVSVTDTVGGSIVGYAGNLGPTDTAYINCDSRPAYDVPGTTGPIPSRGVLLGTSSARSAVSIRGGWPVLRPGAVGSYLLGGSYGAGAGLTVYSRGAYA